MKFPLAKMGESGTMKACPCGIIKLFYGSNWLLVNLSGTFYFILILKYLVHLFQEVGKIIGIALMKSFGWKADLRNPDIEVNETII